MSSPRRPRTVFIRNILYSSRPAGDVTSPGAQWKKRYLNRRRFSLEILQSEETATSSGDRAESTAAIGIHDEEFDGRGSTLATSESPSALNQYSAISTVDLPDQQVFAGSPALQEASPSTSTSAFVEPTTISPAEAIGMAPSITENRDMEEVIDTSRHSPSRPLRSNEIKDMTHVLSQSRRIPRFTPRPDTLHIPPKRTIPLEKEVRPFRGGMQNGYTRWYKSFGNGPLVDTPVCQHAKIGDLFIHSYPGGAEQWLFDKDEQWVVARAGDIHPIFAGRYLSFRNPLEPSWVTHHTYKSYEAVARKEHVANM